MGSQWVDSEKEYTIFSMGKQINSPNYTYFGSFFNR